MRLKRFASFLLVICMLCSLSSCIEQEGTESIVSDVTSVTGNISDISGDFSASENELAVHYLDVGQGDSIFIEFPDNECMLIDASVSKYGDDIVSYISNLGYDTIDYVIATHPDADHIGGMQTVVESFAIEMLYMPDSSTTTNTYIHLAETIIEKGIDARVAEKGVVIINKEDLHAEFLSPRVIDSSDQNKNSAVMMLTYGETKFLFMGDANIEIEDSLGQNIQCDVLKVGHHGSRTSSGENFLKYADPDYAIISCGEGNSYGHPHEETLQRLYAAGATVLRTDELGTITVCSDGTDITVYYKGEDITENSDVKSDSGDSSADEPTSFTWILNTNSMKIHSPDCAYAEKIASANRAESDKTIAELLEDGYTVCGFCKPTD